MTRGVADLREPARVDDLLARVPVPTIWAKTSFAILR